MGSINDPTKFCTILIINQVVAKSLEENSPRKKINFLLHEWRWVSASLCCCYDDDGITDVNENLGRKPLQGETRNSS